MWPRKSILIWPVLLGLIFVQDIYAAPNLILQCLAKEEARLHKEKDQGALYRLNQEFLNELASSNDITLKQNFVEEICNNKPGKTLSHSPSVGLLRILILKKSDIYDLSLSEVEASMRSFKMAYINEFQKQVPGIFIQFISSLQAEMPTPNCLSKAIPELTYFSERLKYLEEELPVQEIMKDQVKIESIFKKLEGLSKIRANCAEEARKKLKALKGQMQKKENTGL